MSNDAELKALGVDGRHERGCVRRYGATETGSPDTDEQAARCACHVNLMWPLSFAEMDIEAGEGIKPHHIADGGYAYQPADKRRYTPAGWEVWKRIAARLGIPLGIDDL